MGEEKQSDWIEQVADRMVLLSAHADLYDEIYQFLNALTNRTFADYDAKRDDPAVKTLIAKHRSAMAIRDDYHNLVRGNREDVELYRTLSLALASTDRELEA